MKWFRYIGTMILLTVAALAAAQESYLIDSVCVGANRFYRVEGEAGSTYEWMITDPLGNLVAEPVGTEFTGEDAYGNPVVGSEVNIAWNTTGTYILSSIQYSLHSCDTTTQGVIKVFDLPDGSPGAPPMTACAGTPVEMSEATAINFSSIEWSTEGDGTFDDPTALKPSYSPAMEDIAAGSVTITMTINGLAQNGTCAPVVRQITITLSNPQLLLTATNLRCFGDNSGAVRAEASGGIGEYQYTWSGPDGFTADGYEITNLAAGTYKVTVTDEFNCSVTGSIEVTEPEEPLITIDQITPVDCHGSLTGSIAVSVSGGTEPYTFLWSGPDGFTANTAVITGLAAGEYNLTVTDGNGCELPETVTITEPEKLLAEIGDLTNIDCFGNDNGTIRLDISGGTGAYTYNWSGPDGFTASTNEITNVAPGEYFITITDENGCTADTSATITEPEALVLSAESTNATCGGKVTGTIDLTVSGGTPFADGSYRYEWHDDNGVIATTEDIADLDGEKYYWVFVTDALNCIDSLRRFINEEKNIELTADFTPIACFGDSTTVTIGVNHGQKPYQYRWMNHLSEIIREITLDEGSDSMMLPAGEYLVVVNDNKGCHEDIPLTLDEPDALQLALQYTEKICENSTTTLTALPTGGTGGYTHGWSGDGAAYLSDLTSANPEFGPAPANSYSLTYTVTDELDCALDTTITMEVSPTFETEVVMPLCEGSEPFVWNGFTIDTELSNSYIANLTSHTGCDSTVTLLVTILPTYAETIDTTLCRGADSFAWNGYTIDTGLSNSYIANLTSHDGCDSVITMIVTILPTYAESIDTTLCQGVEPFEWNGYTIDTELSNNYIANLTSHAGCDSVITMTVTIEAREVPLFTQIDPIDQFTTPPVLPTTSINGITGSWSPVTIDTNVDGSFDFLFTPDGDLCATTYPMTIVIRPNMSTITCIPDTAVECFLQVPDAAASLSDFELAGGSIVGGCTIRPETFAVTQAISEASCPTTIVRTYSVMVSCGTRDTTISCDQTITVHDMTPPVMACPDTVFITPGMPVPAMFETLEAFLAQGSAPDNCGLAANTWSFSETVYAGATIDTLQRTYSVQDSCGWPAECVHWIIVDKDAQMAMACPDTVKVECRSEVPERFADYNAYIAVGGTASSRCGIDEASFRWIEFTESGSCPAFITRLYEISDHCGNRDTCEHIIQIWDQTAPVIDCPAPMTVMEGEEPAVYEDLAAFIAAGGSVDENCGIETFELTDETITGDNPYFINRTYRVADGCDNDATCTQVITVYKPADLQCPPQITVQCIGDTVDHRPYRNVDAFRDAGGTAVNFVEFRYAGDVSDGNTCPETISRRYEITDVTGDTIFCTQQIVVNDTEAPVVAGTLPPRNISSSAPVPTYRTAGEVINAAQIIDNCALNYGRPISFTRRNISSSGCTDVWAYTYTIYDLCDNPVEVVQQITINASGPVVMSPPGPRTDCIAPKVFTTMQEWLDAGGRLTGSAIGMTIEHLADLDETSGTRCDSTITRTYRISSSCGSALSKETVYIQDFDPPQLVQSTHNSPSECVPPRPYDSYSDFVVAGGLVTDNCGLDESSFRYLPTRDEVLQESCPRILVRTYEISDNCGLRINFTDTLTIDDTTPPTAQLGLPEPFNCYGDIPAPDIVWVTSVASDNCGGAVTVDFVSDSEDPGCRGEVIRSYRLTDVCGNDTVVEQIIRIDYSINPVIVKIPIIPESCGIPDPYDSYQAFYDAGGRVGDRRCNQNDEALVLVHMGDVDDGDSCPKEITRTYKLTDECGNDTTFTQIFVINDTEAPTITCPPDLIGSLSVPYTDIPPPYNLDGFLAAGDTADNCGIESFASFTVDSVRQVAEIFITRGYVITDFCGNTDTCLHQIRAYIDEDIFMICPPAYAGEVECFSNLPEPMTWDQFVALGGYAESYFGIDTTTFRLIDQQPETIECRGTVTRTYEVSDSIGKTTTCMHIINVFDREPPSIGCPDTTFVAAGGIIPPRLTTLTVFQNGGGTVYDNCDVRQTVHTNYPFVSEIIRSGITADTLVRTYRIYDNCNLSASCQHVIIMLKDLNLQFTCPPVSATALQCIDEVPEPYTSYKAFEAAGGSAFSIYGIDTTTFRHVAPDEVLYNGQCVTGVTRRYEITDNNNQTRYCEQQFILIDITQPVLNGVPGDLTVACVTAIPAPPAVTATDNCSGDLQVGFSETVSDSTCANGFIIIRTWSAVDNCGNEAIETQTITVSDLENPLITCGGLLKFEGTPDELVDLTELPLAETETEIDRSLKDALGITADDNCAGDSLTYFDTLEGACPVVVTRTFTIYDACGNSTTCEQTIELLYQVEVEVSLAANRTEICEDMTVTFTATHENGGDAPEYAWYVNDQPVATTTTNQYRYTPVHNDRVHVVITSNAGCVVNPVATSNEVSITVVSELLPEVTLTASEDTICEGEEVTYTATPVNEGDDPGYTWYLNGLPIPDSSRREIVLQPEINDEVYVKLTSSAPCAVPQTVSSNPVKVEINWDAPPSVSLVTSRNPICEGETVTFTATPFNGGENPTYTWYVNGTEVQDVTGSTYSYQPALGDRIYVVLTSDAPCLSQDWAESVPITISFTNGYLVKVNLVSDRTEICEGMEVTFTATHENGGDAPEYEWYVNDQPVATTTTNQYRYTPAHNDRVHVVLTSSESCVIKDKAESNKIPISVIDQMTVSVNIEVSENDVCEGREVTFTATPVNKGTNPKYRWFVDGIPIPGFTSDTFTYTPTNGDRVQAELTSNETCIVDAVVRSNIVEMIVKTKDAVTVAITADPMAICEDDAVTYTATAEFEGTNPLYTWYANEKVVQQGSSSILTYTPAATDSVFVVLTSDAACVVSPEARSNKIGLPVTNQVVVSVDISADRTEICEGMPVIFTATAENEGTNPTYAWYRNGVRIPYAEGATITLQPDDQDSIYVVLTTSETCVVDPKAYSDTIVISVTDKLEAAVTIDADFMEVCFGTPVSLSAVPVNGGAGPLYTWFVNSTEVATGADSLYSYVPSDGDSVFVRLTSSETCVTDAEAYSDTLIIFVYPVVCRDDTIYLDENGMASIDPADINRCVINEQAFADVRVSQSEFDCNDIGVNPVTLSVTDLEENVSSCTANITVLDTIIPVAICRDRTFYLDSQGIVRLTPPDVNNNSSDNCGISDMDLSKEFFTCNDVGENIVTLYVIDRSGNQDSCTAIITIIGNLPPVAADDALTMFNNRPDTIRPLINDSDPFSTIVVSTLQMVTPPQHGTVMPGTVAGTFIYTPDSGYVGEDRFTYAICDDGRFCAVMCDTAVVRINLLSENQPPIAMDDYYDAGCYTIYKNVIENDSDPDGRIEGAWLLEDAMQGIVQFYVNGDMVYLANRGFVGQDTLRYMICDDGIPQKCDSAYIFISIFEDTDCDGEPDEELLHLFIPEGFSPNNDGVHDFFKIYNIEELYPNSILRIFDRSGAKLFEKHNYGNLSYWGTDENAWWWGYSEHRLTTRNRLVPIGTYVYVLDTGTGKVYTGTVMVAY